MHDGRSFVYHTNNNEQGPPGKTIMSSERFRTEKDSLGTFKVPEDAWYGVQTARAVGNFPISGRRPDRDFVIAHVRIKRAAAVANNQPGWLPDRLAIPVIEACDKILHGEYLEQFVVDRFQTAPSTICIGPGSVP